MNLTRFFSELKRRNVYKVAVAYIIAGWALSQGIAQNKENLVSQTLRLHR